MTAASLPSAKTHLASDRIPTCSRRVARRTPVHSLVLNSPCVSCAVVPFGPRHSFPVLPEHSIKASRETAGNRLSSSIVKISGRFTSP